MALHELPPGITPHLATSVEFIGRAVRLLRAPPASAKLRQLQERNAQRSYASQVHSSLQWQQQQQQLGWKPSTDQAQQLVQQLLPYDDTLAFASALRVLQQQAVLNQAALERTVEAVRTDVSYICCSSTAGTGARHVQVGAWCVPPPVQPVQAAMVQGTLGAAALPAAQDT